MRSGALIVLEGAEGVGKSTQLSRLADALERSGVACVTLREPGGTAVGEAIRGLLLDASLAPSGSAEALLFLASRAQLVADAIRPALALGQTVLLDRFFLSTYAYQIAGRGLDEGQVMEANQLAVGGLVPDLTLVLELPRGAGLSRAAARGERDRMELADAEFHDRVEAAFSTFGNDAWQRGHPECGPIVRIDASGTEHDVAVAISGAVVQRLPGLAVEVAAADQAANRLRQRAADTTGAAEAVSP
ncbi:MAG: dTMP kinase [Gemmatimonadaceae bacterium]